MGRVRRCDLYGDEVGTGHGRRDQGHARRIRATGDYGRQLVDEPDQGQPGGPVILVVLAFLGCRHAEVEPEESPVKVDHEVTQGRRCRHVFMLVLVVRPVVVVMVAEPQIVLGRGVVTMVSLATTIMGVADRRGHDFPYQHRG